MPCNENVECQGAADEFWLCRQQTHLGYAVVGNNQFSIGNTFLSIYQFLKKRKNLGLPPSPNGFCGSYGPIEDCTVCKIGIVCSICKRTIKVHNYDNFSALKISDEVVIILGLKISKQLVISTSFS